jgi:Ca2+-binding RTX toxin-like protein
MLVPVGKSRDPKKGCTRKEQKMRKALTMTIAGALMMALTAAAAFAAINCAGGTCFGTNDPDTLYGTANVDNIQGLGGDDTIYGKGSNDFLAGDQAFEQTLRGNDKVYGGSGNDELEGNQDNDLLVGGPGNDKLNPLDGQQLGTKDTVEGGRGADNVYANDGNEDVINCGRGTQDIVRYDVGLDTIRNCEIKNPPL